MNYFYYSKWWSFINVNLVDANFRGPDFYQCVDHVARSFLVGYWSQEMSMFLLTVMMHLFKSVDLSLLKWLQYKTIHFLDCVANFSTYLIFVFCVVGYSLWKNQPLAKCDWNRDLGIFFLYETLRKAYSSCKNLKPNLYSSCQIFMNSEIVEVEFICFWYWWW